MKVLFVSGGNSKHFPISPFIKAQGEALRESGVEVSYFTIIGKGALNYIKNISKLRKHIKETKPDIIHAHYSLSGWVAVLAAGRLPVVLSFMGSDAQGNFIGADKINIKSIYLVLLSKMIQPFVNAIITKSPNLEQAVYRKKISYLVPNGVRLDQFKIYDNDACRNELGLKKDKKYVLFLANANDPNKNFALAEKAVQILNRPDVELLNVYKISHDVVVKYFNSVDIFVLCSFAEGSPNVVKEAMTCNCPLVATNVGDVAWVVGDTPGCYVSSHEPEEFALKIAMALDYAEKFGRTQGRERILALGLDSVTIADKIITIYQNVLRKKGIFANEHYLLNHKTTEG